MTWEEALDILVDEGAIRLWKASRGWAVAYRLGREGWEARGLVRAADGHWALAESLAGAHARRNGWHRVTEMHHQASPLDHPGATKNRGYYMGLTRRCETCKRTLLLERFERPGNGGQAFRSWECNDCAGQREREISRYGSKRRLGDYLRRNSHASNPPVKGEL